MNRILHAFAATCITCLCLQSLAFADDDWLKAAPVKPLRGVDIPFTGIRDTNNTFYTGLQFAEGANDVIYLAFDCKEELMAHDEMHVYIPDHPRYGKPVRIRGRKKGDRRLFTIRRIQGKHGDVTLQHTITLSIQSLWDDRKLDVDIEVTCDLASTIKHKKCRFTLKGTLKPKMNRYAELEVSRLIQTPEVRARWDHRSDPPHVRGKIVMGRLALTPDSGMDSHATLILWDKEKPEHKSSKRFRMNPSGSYSEFTYHTGNKIKKGKKYNMKLTVDMGPFFNKLTASDCVVLR